MGNNFTDLATTDTVTAATFNDVLDELDAAIKLNNYAAAASPAVTDDSGDGYTVGSVWIDTTNDRAWVCVDATAGAAVWREINAPGAVCAFAAYNSVEDADQTGNAATATVDFDTEIYDLGGNFASDTFTAPVTGRYLLTAAVLVTGITAAMTTGVITLVTSNRTWFGTDIAAGLGASGATTYLFQVTTVADMDVGDTAIVQIKLSNGAGNTADIYGAATNHATYFTGARVA